MMNVHEDLTREQEVRGSSDRSFGLVFTVVFCVAGLFPLYRGGPIRQWALMVAGVFLLAALAHPRILSPLNRVWMRFGLLLHKITNPIILGAIFYLVFTPMALLLRMLGKDLLRLKMEPGSKTYWIVRQPPGPAPESMSNQF